MSLLHGTGKFNFMVLEMIKFGFVLLEQLGKMNICMELRAYIVEISQKTNSEFQSEVAVLYTNNFI